LGFKDLENYKYINLNGIDEITDVYSLIITKFKEFTIKFSTTKSEDLKNLLNENKYLLNEEELKKIIDYLKNKHKTFKINFNKKNNLEFLLLKLFNRKNLKKSIMTTHYNVSPLSFFKYFFDSLSDDDNYEYLNDENLRVLLSLFYFFNSHFDLFTNLINENPIELIRNAIAGKNFQIKFFDNFTVCFAFFPYSTKNERTTYYDMNNQRWTVVKKFLSDEYDLKKTFRGFDPNLMHSIDAALIRLCLLYSFSKDV